MKTLAIDTSYLIYRSYFAYPDLTYKGNHTGAIYGFIKTVLTLIKQLSPDILIFACDTPEKTWRHEILSTYKAGRPEAEEQMISQIKPILEWCHLVTQNVFLVNGFEADDLIWTACNQLQKSWEGLDKSELGIFETLKEISQDDQFFIFSADRDLYQVFVFPQVSFVIQHKGVISFFRKNEFESKFNLRPEQWVDFKSLVGDTSDNLKGVDGIGPKTAAKILNEVDNLQLLFEIIDLPVNLKNLTTLKNPRTLARAKAFVSDPRNQKLVSKIVANIKTIEQTYLLATLQTVPNIQVSETSFDLEKGAEFLEKYNFISLQKLLKNNKNEAFDKEQATLF